MSAAVFILVVLLALAVGIMIGAYFYEPINEASHAAKRNLRKVPALQRHTGHHRAGAPLVVALPPAQVIAHADTMQRASWEFLPPVPALPPYVPAWQPIERKQTEDHAPWTGSQQKLTPELEAEMERQRLIQEQIDQRGPDVTAADLREILDALREPAFGTDRCEADVLAAELPAATGPERVLS